MNISCCYVGLDNGEICFVEFKQPISHSEVKNLIKISDNGPSLITQLSKIFRLADVQISKTNHFGTDKDVKFWISSSGY